MSSLKTALALLKSVESALEDATRYDVLVRSAEREHSVTTLYFHEEPSFLKFVVSMDRLELPINVVRVPLTSGWTKDCTSFAVYFVAKGTHEGRRTIAVFRGTWGYRGKGPEQTKWLLEAMSELGIQTRDVSPDAMLSLLELFV